MKTIFFQMVVSNHYQRNLSKKNLSGIFLCPIDVLWRLPGENTNWHGKKNVSQEEYVKYNNSLMKGFEIFNNILFN